MRRLVWVALGAAGGVVVYRRAQTMIADARERGVVVSAQQAGLSAISALATARQLAATAAEKRPATRPEGAASRSAGAAARNVLRTSNRATTSRGNE